MKKQIAVIDFGTSKIVTVVANEESDNQLNILGSGIAAYNGFRDGEWVTPRQMLKRVGKSIRDAENASGTKIDEIYVGVPGDYINMLECTVAIELTDPEYAENLINDLFDAAAEKLAIGTMGKMVLHRSAAWFRKDNGEKEMQPSGECKRLEAQISFILAQEIFLEDVTEMLGALNITVLGFASPTLGTALLALSIEDRDRGAVMIDCGYYNTEISVVCGDALVYHVRIPTAGSTFTANIADALDLSMESAEEIKRQYIFNPDRYEMDWEMDVYDNTSNRPIMRVARNEVAPVVEETAEELFGYIESCLNEAKKYLTPQSQVILTGGGISHMRGAAQLLSKKLNRTVRGCDLHSGKLSGEEFSSTQGLVDLVMESVAPRTEEEAAPKTSKTPKFFAFGKKK